MNETKTLASWIVQSRLEDIPEYVQRESLRAILNYAGCALGGSSDAATTLLALNRLWKLDLPRQELQDVALKLGADVPFFVFGKNAFAEGVGEALDVVQLPPRYFLVVTPRVQVPTAAIGQDAFQECDTVGITRPCVKHNFLVKDVRDLAATVKKAFYIARTGRPGPVLIDIPKDVSKAPCQYEPLKSVSLRSYNPVTKGHSGQIRKAVSLLLSAKRPYIYTGGGIILADASRELNQFADLLGYQTAEGHLFFGLVVVGLLFADRFRLVQNRDDDDFGPRFVDVHLERVANIGCQAVGTAGIDQVFA